MVLLLDSGELQCDQYAREEGFSPRWCSYSSWPQSVVGSKACQHKHFGYIPRSLQALSWFFLFCFFKSSINKVPRLFWWRGKAAVCRVESALGKKKITEWHTGQTTWKRLVSKVWCEQHWFHYAAVIESLKRRPPLVPFSCEYWLVSLQWGIVFGVMIWQVHVSAVVMGRVHANRLQTMLRVAQLS